MDLILVSNGQPSEFTFQCPAHNIQTRFYPSILYAMHSGMKHKPILSLIEEVCNRHSSSLLLHHGLIPPIYNFKLKLFTGHFVFLLALVSYDVARVVFAREVDV